MELKSTITLKNKLDYDKVTVIKTLVCTRETLEAHHRQLANLFKNEKPEEIQRRVMDVVARDNAFANIMQENVEKSFEFNISEDDIKNKIEEAKASVARAREERIKKTPDEEKDKIPKLEDYPYFKWTDEQRRNYAIGTIKKELVFNELAKLWDLFVTDDEVKNQLENFYKVSNVSIREYLNDKDRFEDVRKMILAEKITKEVLNRFKVKWELTPPPAPKQAEEKKEENK